MPRQNNPRHPIVDPVRDFDTLPNSAVLRQHHLEALLQVSSATIWRYSQNGLLRPIRFGIRTTGWLAGDVRKLMANASNAEVNL